MKFLQNIIIKRRQDVLIRQANSTEVQTVTSGKIKIIVCVTFSKELPDIKNFLILHSHRVTELIAGTSFVLLSKETIPVLANQIEKRYSLNTYLYQYFIISELQHITYNLQSTYFDEYELGNLQDIFKRR